MDRWLSNTILTRVEDETTRVILTLVLVIALWSAETIMQIRLWRWAISGMQASSGTVLHFDGGVFALFGWVSVSNMIIALVISTRGLIVRRGHCGSFTRPAGLSSIFTVGGTG